MMTYRTADIASPSTAGSLALLFIPLAIVVTDVSAQDKQGTKASFPEAAGILPIKEHYQDLKPHSGAALPSWLAKEEESRWEMPARNYASNPDNGQAALAFQIVRGRIPEDDVWKNVAFVSSPGGLMLSSFFTLVIIAQWLPALFLPPCAK